MKWCHVTGEGVRRRSGWPGIYQLVRHNLTWIVRMLQQAFGGESTTFCSKDELAPSEMHTAFRTILTNLREVLESGEALPLLQQRGQPYESSAFADLPIAHIFEAISYESLYLLFEDRVGNGNAAGRLAIELLFQVSIDCEQVFSGLRQEYGVSYDRIVETAKLHMISKMWHCIQPYLASRRAHSVS